MPPTSRRLVTHNPSAECRDSVSSYRSNTFICNVKFQRNLLKSMFVILVIRKEVNHKYRYSNIWKEDRVKYDEFIAQVQRRAGLNTRADALLATRATLETFGERLEGGEPMDLAAQLPPEIAIYLVQPFAGSGVPFTLNDFFMRVAEREGTTLAEATVLERLNCTTLRQPLGRAG